MTSTPDGWAAAGKGGWIRVLVRGSWALASDDINDPETTRRESLF
jgi:hypothetical protein